MLRGLIDDLEAPIVLDNTTLAGGRPLPVTCLRLKSLNFGMA